MWIQHSMISYHLDAPPTPPTTAKQKAAARATRAHAARARTKSVERLSVPSSEGGVTDVTDATGVANVTDVTGANKTVREQGDFDGGNCCGGSTDEISDDFYEQIIGSNPTWSASRATWHPLPPLLATTPCHGPPRG